MSVSKETNGTYTAQVWYRDWEGDSRREKTKRGFRIKSRRASGRRTSLRRVPVLPICHLRRSAISTKQIEDLI